MSRAPKGAPARTVYHRAVGWHAPAMRRAVIILAIGLVVSLMIKAFTDWRLAALGGWDAAAFTFVVVVWRLFGRATAQDTHRRATTEDETRASTGLLLVAISTASLLGVGFVLHMATHSPGPERAWLAGVAALTVALSWTMLNTIYTLRYADLYYGAAGESVDFGAGQHPDYHDFAYLAFTIGMTYQVSDTALRNRTMRRVVLSHAVLSYVFGVVILAGAVNLIAGLLSSS
jgi:uncharacterized membrane protein